MSHLSAEALFGHSKQRRASLRLTLFPGEALRLPRSCRTVSVWVGAAWISYSGRDFRLLPGETLAIDGKGSAVVSPLGEFALVLELKED